MPQNPLARVNESYAFCHHGGWYECDMQTHALCAKKLKPSDPFAMYEYIECNFGNLGKNDADNTRLCAANATLDKDDMWKCATGYGADSGPGMLLASAQLADEKKINLAPTVILDGKMLGHTLTLKDVCDAYTGPKPPGCNAADLEAQVATTSAPCHV